MVDTLPRLCILQVDLFFHIYSIRNWQCPIETKVILLSFDMLQDHLNPHCMNRILANVKEYMQQYLHIIIPMNFIAISYSTRIDLPFCPPAQNWIVLLEELQLLSTLVPGIVNGSSTFLKVRVATECSRYAFLVPWLLFVILPQPVITKSLPGSIFPILGLFDDHGKQTGTTADPRVSS